MMHRVLSNAWKCKIKNTRYYCDGGLPTPVTTWLEDMCDLLHPKNMHICDGSLEEREAILQELIDNKIAIKLKQQNNCFLIRSDPRDTRRDSSRVFTAAYNREEFLPTSNSTSCEGSPTRPPSLLGNFMSMTIVDQEINNRFFKSMRGRKMYVIPFVLGPATGDTKIMGIQLTDSALVALLTTLLVHSGQNAQVEMLRKIEGDSSCSQKFVKLIHASGCDPNCPPNWPSDLEKYMIINMPEKREIWSYGSSYWENSLLVKKGAALQLAADIGRKEKFLALNMSVLSVESPNETKFIGVMGPSGSGKSVITSMSAQQGPCPLKIKLVSDDISWIKLNQQSGSLNALNPEIGVFPYIKGINCCSTPILNTVACSNSILLNTGMSGSDLAWWEGLNAPDKDDSKMTDWRGKPWLPEGPRAAHLDARFCNSMLNMPNLNGCWECGTGVPLSAIIILNRRSSGHPLILETCSWQQGILHAASLRTRYHSTPLDSNELHWDPMGSRQYLGYNLGKMIDNWMSLANVSGLNLPKIYLANLFLMDNRTKEHMWIGYEHNLSIIKWVLNRLKGTANGVACPIGILPCENDFEMPHRQIYTFDSMVSFNQDYWQCELNQFQHLLQTQMPEDISEMLCRSIVEMKDRLNPCPCPCPCPCPSPACP